MIKKTSSANLYWCLLMNPALLCKESSLVLVVEVMFGDPCYG